MCETSKSPGRDARAVAEVHRVQRSSPENLSLAGHGCLSATTCAAALPGDSPLVERRAGSWVRTLRWGLRGRAAPPLRGLPEPCHDLLIRRLGEILVELPHGVQDRRSSEEHTCGV